MQTGYTFLYSLLAGSKNIAVSKIRKQVGVIKYVILTHFFLVRMFLKNENELVNTDFFLAG